MSTEPGHERLRVFLLGLLASPAAAFARAERGRRHRALACLGGLAVCLAVAVALLALPLRREAVSIAWAAFVVVGSLVAARAAGRSREAASDARGEAEVAPERERHAGREVAAAVLAIVAAPSVVLFAHMTAATLLGQVLVRLNPGSLDPDAIGRSIGAGILWATPLAVLFTVVSVRQGRLLTLADTGKALLAWTTVLFLVEAIAAGWLHLLRSQSLPADLEAWPQTRDMLVLAGVAVAIVPLALDLAWGSARPAWRLGRAALVLAAATFNLSLLAGLTAEAEFALGRLAERSGRTEMALHWYGRSLVARSTPLRESYLQHHIGLLHYLAGRPDRARDAFRLVQTSRDAHPEIVRESAWFLERLELERKGSRLVLPMVQQATEHRGDYCAPNTLALVLRYWGRDLSPGEIGEEIAFVGGGTAFAAIDRFTARVGFDHLLVPLATVEDVGWLIEHGIPVLLYLPRHVLAVFGKDDRLETWVTYDTATWDIWVDHPVPYLLPGWGQQLFTLGVLLPRDRTTPELSAARARFGGPRAASASLLKLARGTVRPDERRGLLRAALEQDPSSFPAALDLAAPTTRDWLAAHVDVDGIAAAAHRALEREQAPVDWIGERLASWLYLFGKDRELLELAAEMERRGHLDPVRRQAALAAVRLEDWTRASDLLAAIETPADEDGDKRGWSDVLRAKLKLEMALGHRDRAADGALEVAGATTGDERESAVKTGFELAPGRGPVYLSSLLAFARPEDFPARLAYVEALLDASAAEPTNRRERLQQARQAGHAILAITRDGAVQEKARALLARIDHDSGR